MSSGASPPDGEQKVTITLTKEDAEQLREFLKNVSSLNALARRLESLASDGQLESLGMVLSAARSLRDALNDEAIQKLASSAGKTYELVSTLTDGSAAKALMAVGEHGEQLAALLAKVGQLQRDGVFESLSQAAYTLKASLDALNEEAVANLAATLSEGAALWRRLAPILGAPELERALVRVAQMEREGVLAALVDVGYAVKSLKDSLNDEAMTNLATTVAEALNIWRTLSPYIQKLSSSPIPILLEAMSREGLAEQLRQAKPRSGMAILSPSDPDIRKGFGVLLELLKAIGSEFGGEEERKQQ